MKLIFEANLGALPTVFTPN